MKKLLAIGCFLAASAALAQDAAAPTTVSGFLLSLAPHALSLLGLLMTALVFPALRNWLTQKAETSKLANVALKVEHLAEAAEAHVRAGLQAKLTALTADGNLSEADRAELKAETMRLLKEFLGKNGLDSITGVLGLGAGLVDTYLSGILEKKAAAALADVIPEADPK